MAGNFCFTNVPLCSESRLSTKRCLIVVSWAGKNGARFGESVRAKENKVAFLSAEKWPATRAPSGCYMLVTVGFQCARETSPRCGGATVPPCNHSGCPTTPSKAILKHMTTPYGALYQITNFPREQNSLILNRPRDQNT